MNTLRGFDRMFADGRLTLGLFMPIEAYHGSIPTMRDVPLFDPAFGDAGQIYDPWVYFSYLAVTTRRVALAADSIMLPLFPAQTRPTPVQEPTAKEAAPHSSPVGQSLIECADAVRARI